MCTYIHTYIQTTVHELILPLHGYVCICCTLLRALLGRNYVVRITGCAHGTTRRVTTHNRSPNVYDDGDDDAHAGTATSTTTWGVQTCNACCRLQLAHKEIQKGNQSESLGFALWYVALSWVYSRCTARREKDSYDTYLQNIKNEGVSLSLLCIWSLVVQWTCRALSAHFN